MRFFGTSTPWIVLFSCIALAVFGRDIIVPETGTDLVCSSKPTKAVPLGPFVDDPVSLSMAILYNRLQDFLVSSLSMINL